MEEKTMEIRKYGVRLKALSSGLEDYKVKDALWKSDRMSYWNQEVVNVKILLKDIESGKYPQYSQQELDDLKKAELKPYLEAAVKMQDYHLKNAGKK